MIADDIARFLAGGLRARTIPLVYQSEHLFLCSRDHFITYMPSQFFEFVCSMADDFLVQIYPGGTIDRLPAVSTFVRFNSQS
ncbi:hypothetical protein [Mycolicibacterium mageritense]|uniref:hypothetical protein n=1 Tax=Mycolicibacterium mageritense TaxID=53462 RepID=UPI001E61E69B|nr:hypothetical protein [Mycolicibacterium mageritense]